MGAYRIGLAADDDETTSDPIPPSIRRKLKRRFVDMMRAVYRLDGARFEVELMGSDEVQAFVRTHAEALDHSFAEVEMTDAMRDRLSRSDYVFSGLKAFHECHEAFPSLLAEDGTKKPFEVFREEVLRIDRDYNVNYLRTEYHFAHASALMASRWEQAVRDGDQYLLQYRTAGDDRVRPEHAAMEGITLPPSDPFWEEFLPPNGWNCRCTAVQVRRGTVPVSDSDEAIALGEVATQRDTRGMFRFNPGIHGTFPPYNPYTISACKTCPVAKGDAKLARAFVSDNEVCDACRKFH